MRKVYIDWMEVIITEREPKAKSAMVALQMPERLRQLIRKEAYEREMSFSAMVRRVLEEHYSENGGEN